MLGSTLFVNILTKLIWYFWRIWICFPYFKNAHKLFFFYYYEIDFYFIDMLIWSVILIMWLYIWHTESLAECHPPSILLVQPAEPLSCRPRSAKKTCWKLWETSWIWTFPSMKNGRGKPKLQDHHLLPKMVINKQNIISGKIIM